MSEVAVLQRHVRDALLTGKTEALAGLIRGGADPEKRLAIHQRQYRVSLVTSLVERFPATAWLVGSEFLSAAADTFVSECPPTRPCIAEYGEDFPACLAQQPGASRVPYLRQFAALEWQLVRVSLAIDLPSLTAADLQSVDPDRLPATRLILQPGLHYMRLDWALDELISLYLTDRTPSTFTLDSGPVLLEVRGARGEPRLNRLDPAQFAFRSALASGHALADATTTAVQVDEGFDIGRALVQVVSEQLVTDIEDITVSTVGGGVA